MPLNVYFARQTMLRDPFNRTKIAKEVQWGYVYRLSSAAERQRHLVGVPANNHPRNKDTVRCVSVLLDVLACC